MNVVKLQKLEKELRVVLVSMLILFIATIGYSFVSSKNGCPPDLRPDIFEFAKLQSPGFNREEWEKMKKYRPDLAENILSAQKRLSPELIKELIKDAKSKGK